MTGFLPFPTGWQRDVPLHRYLVCDVFTSEPLQGNQLAVFTDGRPFTSDEMQRVAREMNFSETVFVLPPAGEGDVSIRIFTPTTELPFAGHPVIGTAFVVGEALGSSQVTLEARAGPIPVSLEWDRDRIVFGRMRQPVPRWEPFAREHDLLQALGIEASLLAVEVYRNGPAFVYVRLPDEPSVARLQPDMAALRELGVGASCFAGRDGSWTTRMFYPAAGVAEDPATGSAAGPLAVHLARHGEIAFGQEITIHQGGSVGRPSVLFARVTGDQDRIDTVEVGGGAVVVAEGSLRITNPG